MPESAATPLSQVGQGGSRKILIVGGGIAGLGLAIGLGRAGHPCDLVEIQKDWQALGTGLIQPGNALRAYGVLGLLDACLEQGFLFTRQRHFDADGRLLREVALPQIEGIEVVGTCGIPRPALHGILSTEAVRLGAQVRLGTSIAALERGADNVTVRFTDGAIGRYDLVVGADGIYSKVRSLAFDPGLKPRFTGQGCWRFSTARPPEMTWSSANHGPNRVGLVPISRDEMYMFMLSPEPDNPLFPQDDLPRLMRERLHGYTGQIAEIAERIERPEDVIYRPLEILKAPPPWHHGNVVLIGDAAHATTPHNAQGAAMAIEDAVVLAELLTKRDGSLDAILQEYYSRRYDRCSLVVNASEQIGLWQINPNESTRDQEIALAEKVRKVLAEPL
jgi:2-polyprenyl-6-methoxyphenol hydroxylase-like FAD-dependent oxidoreductase